MSANGRNFRLHSYCPDNMALLSPVMHAETTNQAWLLPVKYVYRDTYINQYTWYIEATIEPPDGNELTAEICLYRVIENTTSSPAVSRTIAIQVTGSSVSQTSGGGPVISQTQWILDNPINLEGGTYWWGIRASTSIDREGLALWNFVGVTDADSNIQYPKYDLTIASAALPSTIDITNITVNTTDWQYISGEWY